MLTRSSRIPPLQRYLDALDSFIAESFPTHLQPPLHQSLHAYFPYNPLHSSSSRPISRYILPAMLDYPLIHQTDRLASKESEQSGKAWQMMEEQWRENLEEPAQSQAKHWSVKFYDDAKAWAWLESLRVTRNHQKTMAQSHELDERQELDQQDTTDVSKMEWAWVAMTRGVLRADYFRYLVILFRGGVVSKGSG